MRILGLSAFHHDAAAALVVDGVPVAAAQEERFTRKRFDPAFPKRAARWCLQEGGVHVPDLDHVVFYEKPLRKFERLLATQLRAFPRSSLAFSKSMFLWLGDRLWMKNRIADELEVDAKKILFAEHHGAHAAAAFLTSPFDEAAILIVDGVGEWATTTLARGSGGKIEVLGEIHFPHSLGLFVSAVTQFLGFEPGADEGKVLALGALGEPRMRDELAALIPAGEDGGFVVDPAPFRFDFDGQLLFGDGLGTRLGPPRKPTDPLRVGDNGSASAEESRDADLAASLRSVVEERVLALARELHAKAPSANLCFGGELALHGGLNERLLREGPFEHLYVPPSPDDAGGALGAALSVHQVRSAHPARPPAATWWLGESIDTAGEEGAEPLGGDDAVRAELVRRLSGGEVVGWVRRRMEFGPRSLGHRSLLADACSAAVRERALTRVRQSEAFLPPSLAVPLGRVEELFEVPAGSAWPLRLGQLALRARDAARASLDGALQADGTAIVQAVDPELDPDLHAVLEGFGKAADFPVLLHDTLQRRGAPMPRNEHDAVELLKRSSLDALIVEDRLYRPE